MEKAVATVTGALAQAFVLILIVLALFLLNIRATLLVLISIPLSIGLALMLMAWWGISANLMSSGWAGHRHRHDGGRLGRDDGEHLQAPVPG